MYKNLAAIVVALAETVRETPSPAAAPVSWVVAP